MSNGQTVWMWERQLQRTVVRKNGLNFPCRVVCVTAIFGQGKELFYDWGVTLSQVRNGLLYVIPCPRILEGKCYLKRTKFYNLRCKMR